VQPVLLFDSAAAESMGYALWVDLQLTSCCPCLG